MTPSADPDEQIRTEWSAGSYDVVGRAFVPMAARLVDAAGVGTGDTVLDVACGTGNVALTAARRGATVTGVDITPAMLATASDRAAVLDVDVDWREGDAAALLVDDDAVDVTLSCLGHMFAHDPTTTAAELHRVTEPGGRIAFTAWTPESAIAAMMIELASAVPEVPGAGPPPFLWGDPDVVRERLGDRVASLRFETGVVRYPALSPAHFWHAMTTTSGPVIVALEDVDSRDREALREAVIRALEEHFAEADNAMELEYRLVTATVQ